MPARGWLSANSVRTRHRVGLRLGIGVGDDHERRGGSSDAAVGVRGEAERALVVDEVADHDELAHLRLERGHAPRELRPLLVHDDDGRDAHSSLR